MNEKKVHLPTHGEEFFTKFVSQMSGLRSSDTCMWLQSVSLRGREGEETSANQPSFSRYGMIFSAYSYIF